MWSDDKWSTFIKTTLLSTSHHFVTIKMGCLAEAISPQHSHFRNNVFCSVFPLEIKPFFVLLFSCFCSLLSINVLWLHIVVKKDIEKALWSFKRKMVFHLKAKVKLLRLDSDGGLWFVKSCLLVHFQQSDFRTGFPVAFLRKTHFRSGWTPGVFTIVSHTLEVVLRGIPLYLHAYPHDSHVFVPPPCHDASHLALTGCCVYDEVPRLHVVTHNWCCRPPLFEESLNQLDILLHSSSQREALSFL